VTASAPDNTATKNFSFTASPMEIQSTSGGKVTLTYDTTGHTGCSIYSKKVGSAQLAAFPNSISASDPKGSVTIDVSKTTGFMLRCANTNNAASFSGIAVKVGGQDAQFQFSADTITITSNVTCPSGSAKLNNACYTLPIELSTTQGSKYYTDNATHFDVSWNQSGMQQSLASQPLAPNPMTKAFFGQVHWKLFGRTDLLNNAASWNTNTLQSTLNEI